MITFFFRVCHSFKMPLASKWTFKYTNGCVWSVIYMYYTTFAFVDLAISTLITPDPNPGFFYLYARRKLLPTSDWTYSYKRRQSRHHNGFDVSSNHHCSVSTQFILCRLWRNRTIVFFPNHKKIKHKLPYRYTEHNHSSRTYVTRPRTVQFRRIVIRYFIRKKLPANLQIIIIIIRERAFTSFSGGIC